MMNRKSIAHKLINGEINQVEFDKLILQIIKKEKINPRTQMRLRREYILYILIICFENTKIKPKAALDDYLAGIFEIDSSAVRRAKAQLKSLYKDNRFIFYDDEQYLTLVIVNKKHVNKQHKLTTKNFDEESLIIRLDKNKMSDGIYDLSFPIIKPSDIPVSAIIS